MPINWILGHKPQHNIYYNIFEEKQSYNDSVSGKAKIKSKAVVQA